MSSPAIALNKIAKEPNQIAIRVGEYLKAGDLDGIVSMFHPDVQVFFPPTEPPHVGLDAVRAVFAPFCEMKPILISEVTSEVINGDTALLQANWRMEDEEGNVLSKGQSTEVAKRLENGGSLFS